MMRGSKSNFLPSQNQETPRANSAYRADTCGWAGEGFETDSISPEKRTLLRIITAWNNWTQKSQDEDGDLGSIVAAAYYDQQESAYQVTPLSIGDGAMTDDIDEKIRRLLYKLPDIKNYPDLVILVKCAPH